MTWFQALVLGVVQGVTEFLPVSSSGHLAVVPWLFGWKDPGLAFDVFLHLGTLLALVLYFFGDLWNIFCGGIISIVERRIGYQRDRALFWLIGLGTVPAVVVGLLWGHEIEATFRQPLLIAVFLAFVGFLMFWVDGKYPGTRSIEEVGFADALLIGLAQACALIPGVSRSGSTIAMGRRLGFQREVAARFSFLLSVPVILGALTFELKDLVGQFGEGHLAWGYLVTGFLASLISGLISIHFLLQFLRTTSLGVFAVYRAFLALLIVVLSLFFGM